MASLLEKELLILDGGLGTALEDQHGVVFSDKTPLWSSHMLVESPQTLAKVQKDFADAGADVILTATYQASFGGFSKTKIGESGIGRTEAEQYMRSAVKISRSAFAGCPGLVALSLGAYGATMQPSTEYSGEYGSVNGADLVDFHRDRIMTFMDVWSDIDIVAIETVPRLDEVRAARQVMRDLPEKPYWIACVFPNDDKLPDGSSIELLVQEMLQGSYKPFAIGLNCTKVKKVADLVQKFEEAAVKAQLDLPRLVIYPDGAGGLVYDTKLWKWIGDNEEDKPWDEQVYEIVEGIQRRGKWKGILVGGCCKTTPQQIERLRKRLMSA